MILAYHGFPRQKYCNRLPFPSSRDLPDPGMETILCLAGGFFTTGPPGKLLFVLTNYNFPHLTCQKTLPDLSVQIFFQDGFQLRGLWEALASLILGVVPPPIWTPKESFCICTVSSLHQGWEICDLLIFHSNRVYSPSALK